MKKNVKNLAMSAVFCAMTFVVTFIRLPVLSSGGYIHLGDTVIYLCACLLPTPYAVLSASIGGVLADILSGAAVWVPATAVIKAVLPLFFVSSTKTFRSRRNTLGTIWAGLVSVGGYYIAEALLFNNLTVPLLSVWGNIIQAVCCALTYLAVASALDRIGAKQHLGL